MTWEEYERRVVLTALATDCPCLRGESGTFENWTWHLPIPGVYVSPKKTEAHVQAGRKPFDPCPLKFTHDEAREIYELWKQRRKS